MGDKAEVQKHLLAGQKAYKAGSLDGALDMAKRALKAGGSEVTAVHLLFGAILEAFSISFSLLTPAGSADYMFIFFNVVGHTF